MKIITADERMREKAGVKMLLVGPAKIGKTTQLRTLDPERTLFVDLEAGDLAVRDVRVDALRPQTWEQCRDLACFLTGPNPALPNGQPTSFGVANGRSSSKAKRLRESFPALLTR